MLAELIPGSFCKKGTQIQRAVGNPREPLDPQETPWSPFIVGSLGFTPDCCKRPLRPLPALGNRSLASERSPDPWLQLGTALRPSVDKLQPPRPSDLNGSSETVTDPWKPLASLGAVPRSSDPARNGPQTVC
ncbi:hypothetical protein PGTUg99_030705 [Puccinia graminis f. sp. tritici]|uniref:Uncharacterized protein n=1 Tax=Puccinia graminis f. sp. tritici TaxID=56615 RepID=A0A5B0RG45_PUCGR|nr:hypothetical protein PGTUg99_030705 [Puccinia graminis f. sp. tritici]